ncbi:MAG: hypothetical protein PUD43_02180 [Clostridia bacterium]|nr:hypothetical protein [Clostridia bacterium]
MICIGVFGEVSVSFGSQLAKKFSETGRRTEIFSDLCTALDIRRALDDAENTGVDTAVVFTDILTGVYYDVVIFASAGNRKDISSLKGVKKGGLVIVNADDCPVLPHILPHDVFVITCGMNSRSALTFSGVGENRNGRERLQCCVQRRIKTLSGKYIEPQEFGVDISGNGYPLSEVLLIMAAALGCENTAVLCDI